MRVGCNDGDGNDGTESNKGSEVDFTVNKSTELYLPAGAEWYDFGRMKLLGWTEITRETSIDLIPLYIKAGSILPIGPKVQYATERTGTT